MKNNTLNCWKLLKLVVPQRKVEIPKRDGYESRKKLRDGARLNPKHRYNGQSAAKPRTAERSTTIPQGSRLKRAEVVCPSFEGEDIVCALSKGKDVERQLQG